MSRLHDILSGREANYLLPKRCSESKVPTGAKGVFWYYIVRHLNAESVIRCLNSR